MALIASVVSGMFPGVFQPFSRQPAVQAAVSAPVQQAQGGCQVFPQTGKSACGKFLSYWQSHGGLAQQGYPLTNQFMETSDLNGQIYLVQYFERAVFEMHPENPPPYDVLLSQLGTFRLKARYPDGVPGDTQPPPYSNKQEFAIDQACSSSGQLCAEMWTTLVQTKPQLMIDYQVPGTHCSPIRLHIYLDGKLVKISQWLGWTGATGSYASLPLSTGPIDIGLISPGTHTIGLQAEGQPVGCNIGQLAAWQGTLEVLTP